MRKKVSCHVITYNHINYISKCIDGILMQKTNFDFEIIIGDDLSTDGTREILEYYATKYPHLIKLNLRNKRGIGIPGKENFLSTLVMCSGEYITLCDGDDYWTDPYKLQKQVDFLEANEDYVACSGLALNSLTNDFVHKVDEIKTDLVLEDFIFNSPIVTGTVLFRNTDFKSYFEFANNHMINDWILWLHLILKNGSNKKIKYFKELFAVYRIHEGGVFSQLGKMNFHKYYYNYLGSVYHIIALNNKNAALKFKCKLNEKRIWHSVQIYRILLEEKKYMIASLRLVKLFFEVYNIKKILGLIREFKNSL